MRAVHEAIEDGVGDGRVGDHLVLVLHVDLTGHDRRATALPVIEYFQEIAALIRRQMAKPPVVEDQQLRAGDALEQATIAARILSSTVDLIARCAFRRWRPADPTRAYPVQINWTPPVGSGGRHGPDCAARYVVGGC